RDADEYPHSWRGEMGRPDACHELSPCAMTPHNQLFIPLDEGIGDTLVTSHWTNVIRRPWTEGSGSGGVSRSRPPEIEHRAPADVRLLKPRRIARIRDDHPWPRLLSRRLGSTNERTSGHCRCQTDSLCLGFVPHHWVRGRIGSGGAYRLSRIGPLA